MGGGNVCSCVHAAVVDAANQVPSLAEWLFSAAVGET